MGPHLGSDHRECGRAGSKEIRRVFAAARPQRIARQARGGDWFKGCSAACRMKQHILVVDDEEQICDLLCLYLTKQGYRVSTSRASAEARRLLQEDRVDLVVLDIGLAHEDGLKVLQDMKSAHPDVKVVMLTGMGFVEDLLQEAHLKGADGYVSKVLPLDELLVAIQRTLKPDGAALSR
jgi:DNA-binding NtrC family response regulator